MQNSIRLERVGALERAAVAATGRRALVETSGSERSPRLRLGYGLDGRVWLTGSLLRNSAARGPWIARTPLYRAEPERKA